MEHAAELEADFQQFYRLDLTALLDAGEWRRAAALASQLPRESRTLRAIEPALEWGSTEQLLAAVVDNLSYLRYEQSGGKGRKPRAVERPGAERARRRTDRTVHGMSAERVGEILARPRA